MPASSPSDPSGSSSQAGPALTRASGEIVHEQTVRAPIPVAPTETTVRAPMPMPPAQEQTVRAFVPSAVPGAASPALEVEELEEVEVEPEADAESAPRGFDVGALVSELEARVRRISSEDVPIARPDQITAPEAAVKTSELLASAPPPQLRRPRARRRRDEGPALRPEPPAVSGEVSVSEPEPGDLFSPPSRVEQRARTGTAPARAPGIRRDDPPLVSGEVAIDSAAARSPEVPAGDVRVMTPGGPQSAMAASGSHPIMVGAGSPSIVTASGAQPIMTGAGPQARMAASGSHPIMTGAAQTSSGSHPVMAPPGAGRGSMTGSGASPVVPRRTSTEAVPVVPPDRGGSRHVRSDTTGPHRVVRLHRSESEGSRDSLVLWVLAGALVVLAVGVVMMVISWAR